MLIDQACGYAPPQPRKTATDEEKRSASAVAGSVLWHIDQMYPAMWNGVPKSARTSLRNTIQAEVITALIGAANAEILPQPEQSTSPNRP